MEDEGDAYEVRVAEAVERVTGRLGLTAQQRLLLPSIVGEELERARLAERQGDELE